jgi:putative DNA primase/helicase
MSLSTTSAESNGSGAGALDQAQSLLAARIGFLPIRADGSKAPAVDSWDPYKLRLPTGAEADDWFGNGSGRGIAVIGGRVSGNLGILDSEYADFTQALCELVEAQEPGLIGCLPRVQTPGKGDTPGDHFYFRSPTPLATTKLACLTADEALKRTGDPNRRTAIELKAEGGYVLAPGCPAACHPSGRLYRHVGGPFIEEVPTLTEAQVALLLSCARALNRTPGPKVEDYRGRGEEEGGTRGTRPGDYFNRRADWRQILEPHGWVFVCERGRLSSRGPVWYLRRPGKDRGISATVGYCKSETAGDLLCVFSTNADPFTIPDGKDHQCFSKFAAHALLNHGGDFKAAARSLPAPKEAADDPHRLARLFVRERCRHENTLTLRCWRQEWHRWSVAESAYRIVPEKELRAELVQCVKAEMDWLNLHAQDHAKKEGKPPPAARKVTTGLIANVTQALAGLTVLPSRLEQPAWLGGEGPFPAGEVLACKNGLVHLPSLVAGKDHRLAPTPRFFSGNRLDIDFDLAATPPAAWLEFLGRLWPDDPASIQALQEWLGYFLTPDTSQQKILLLVGPRRSGKGTIGRVLGGLLGAANVAGPTLGSLGTNFGLWPLLGKIAAIVSDARLSGRSDLAVIVERLLSISGEDAQTIDRKNLVPVTTKLAVRFMILTNELPRLTDGSGALAGRMIVLRLKESWYGKEDTGLTARLLAELPGILLWSIAGWQRLNQRGHFLQPPSGHQLVRDLEDLSSPVSTFVREECLLGANLETPVKELFDRWCRWCESIGRREPGTLPVFARDLRAHLPGLEARRYRPPGEDDERTRTYIGIGLRPKESVEVPF